MPLSSRSKNQLVDKINTCFAKLGNANGTKPPQMTNNLEPYAWSLWLAQHLMSLANKRREMAMSDAVKAGLIFDKDKNPAEPGTKDVLFSGDMVQVSVEVRQPVTRVDPDAVLDYLATKGVKQSLLDAAREHASKVNKPAHYFSTMLITDDVAK